MGKLKIAIPTKAYASLEDTVSEVFGKTKTFTIVDIENGQASLQRAVRSCLQHFLYEMINYLET